MKFVIILGLAICIQLSHQRSLIPPPIHDSKELSDGGWPGLGVGRGPVKVELAKREQGKDDGKGQDGKDPLIESIDIEPIKIDPIKIDPIPSIKIDPINVLNDGGDEDARAEPENALGKWMKARKPPGISKLAVDLGIDNSKIPENEILQFLNSRKLPHGGRKGSGNNPDKQEASKNEILEYLNSRKLPRGGRNNGGNNLEKQDVSENEILEFLNSRKLPRGDRKGSGNNFEKPSENEILEYLNSRKLPRGDRNNREAGINVNIDLTKRDAFPYERYDKGHAVLPPKLDKGKKHFGLQRGVREFGIPRDNPIIEYLNSRKKPGVSRDQHEVHTE